MTLNTQSTLDDFIQFFEGIPDEKWCETVFYSGEKCCAAGHINKNFGFKCRRVLHSMASMYFEANDNLLPKYQHLPTPRLRVVEYLKDVRDGRSIE